MKVSGNMVILNRCMEHGYKLCCACQGQFQWVPGSVNSIEIEGRPRAMCPHCSTIWDWKGKWAPRAVLYCMKVMIDAPGITNGPHLHTLVRGPSPTDAIAAAWESLSRYSPRLALASLSVVFVSDDEFNAEVAKYNQKKDLSFSGIIEELFYGEYRDDDNGC